jgi:hypothetical protein
VALRSCWGPTRPTLAWAGDCRPLPNAGHRGGAGGKRQSSETSP